MDDDILRAEAELRRLERAWHLAHPDRKNEAFARYLAALEWVEALQQREKVTECER